MSLQDVLEFLPTPTATSYGYNQSASAGAAIRKSLDGVVRDLLPTPSASDGTGGPGVSPNRQGGSNLRTAVLDFGKYQAAVDRWTSRYGEPPAPTLPDGRGGNHRFNPLFARWMMGLDHVALESLPRKQQLMAIGNSVCVPAAAHAYSELLKRKNDPWLKG